MNCPSVPIPEDLRRLLYGRFNSRGCGYKDVWLLPGSTTAQEDERWTQTLLPNAEALALKAQAGPAAQTVVSSPEPRRRQPPNFPEKMKRTQCGRPVSSAYPRYRDH